MRRERGLSLIEVLVAFFIFSLVVGGALQLVGSSLRLADTARDHGQARMVAESVIDRVGADIPLAPGEYSGVEAGDYRWEVTINPHSPTQQRAETGIDALNVHVRVSWGTETPRSVSLRTRLPVPYVTPQSGR